MINKNKHFFLRLDVLFLIFLFCFYFVLFFFNVDLFLKSLIASFLIVKKLFVSVLLMFLLFVLYHKFLSEDVLKKHLSRHSGIKGWFFTLFVGIFSIGPVYGWYDILSDLKKKGVLNKFIAGFLYSRAIKVELIPLLILYFGVKYSVFLSLLIILGTFITGSFVGFFTDKKS